MTSVLTSLASRKLETARKAALLHLQARQETIELIHRAEEVADHRLPWDWQQITSADVPASEVNAADYLTVLSISDKAVASDRQLLVDAREQMARLEKKRSATVEKLCLSVSDLKKETEEMKAAANDKLRESETKAKQVFYDRESPTQPGFPADPATGCGSSFLTLVIAFVPLGYVLGFLGFGISTPGMLLGFSVLFGFLGIPAILRIKWQKKCEAIDLKAHMQSDRLILDANNQHIEELAVIDRHMPNHIHARATELTGAEELFSKARDASAILLAHEAKHAS